MKMTLNEVVTKYGEWLVERFYVHHKSGACFSWFWDSIASQVTVVVLRDAARILKIRNPAQTRAGLRDQFATKWTEED